MQHGAWVSPCHWVVRVIVMTKAECVFGSITCRHELLGGFKAPYPYTFPASLSKSERGRRGCEQVVGEQKRCY